MSRILVVLQHCCLESNINGIEATHQQKKIRRPDDAEPAVVAGRKERIKRWVLDAEQLEQSLDLTTHQEGKEPDTVTAQHLQHEKSKSPRGRDVVNDQPKYRKSIVSVFPVCCGTVLVDGQQHRHSPGPALKPVKEHGVRTPKTTAILGANHV